jgi:hypothetical protein
MMKDDSLKESPLVAKEDWRKAGVFEILDGTSPWTKKKYPKGAIGKIMTHAKYGGKTLAFDMPSMPALFLDFSNEMWSESHEVLAEPKNFKVAGPYASADTFPQETELIFETIQNAMASIVFAYTGLEVFANEIIPEGYAFELERKDKKCTETYDRIQIERHLSLAIKLDQIVSKILGVNSPKGTRIWKKFRELEKLRNRIIHMKTVDKQSAGPEDCDKKLWTFLLRKHAPNYAHIAKEIITYFFTKKPKKDWPRWLRKIPF